MFDKEVDRIEKELDRIEEEVARNTINEEVDRIKKNF